MGKKWIPIVFFVAVALLAYVLLRSSKQTPVDDSIVIKKPNQKQNTKAPEHDVAADKKQSTAAAAARLVQSVSIPEQLDPLKNPFLEEKKKRNSVESNWFGAVNGEKREQLKLRMMGNDNWSIFTDLRVTKDSIHNPLFSFGPYQVSRNENFGFHNFSMSLIYNENQQVLGVLTGRVVIKMRDMYDMNPMARDHGLKVENVSAPIRTAYLNASHLGQLDSLNEALKTDQRIERFYFEVVRADLMRN